MPTITIVSQVIGFISFGITLLTLLGVYRDLISTMRNAPHQIPIMLGNLRQELEAERTAIGRRVHQGDEFNVFPRRVKTDRGWKKPKTGEVAMLLNFTITELWNNFKALERPFLIRSGNRAEQVRKGDYWGDRDVGGSGDEKGGGGRKRDKSVKNTMGMEEANTFPDQQRYYRTGLSHRFIWWQSKSDVVSLMEQVQRVQIRRIERDMFETDELVKRIVRVLAARGEGGGEGDGSGSGSGSGSDGGGGRGLRRRRSGKAKSRESVPVRSRSRNKTTPVAYRESREVETVRVRDPGQDRARDRDRPKSSAEPEPASNTGRRRDGRASYEDDYEFVRPGRVEVVDVDRDVGRRPSGRYEREVHREKSRSRDRDRKRDRSRYDG